ncbi:hypothetical protein GBA52_010292 [Prunus armeniaca]|nr:hypothetical protein GBA52_010292 [Prunus armeniaca]
MKSQVFVSEIALRPSYSQEAKTNFSQRSLDTGFESGGKHRDGSSSGATSSWIVTGRTRTRRHQRPHRLSGSSICHRGPKFQNGPTNTSIKSGLLCDAVGGATLIYQTSSRYRPLGYSRERWS